MTIIEDTVGALLKESGEAEWLEFKHNNDTPDKIGETISAIANSVALAQKEQGWIIWGVEDKTRRIIGTAFQPRQRKVGNEELENWLATQLDPRIDVRIHELSIDDKRVVAFEVPAATYRPVAFKGHEYIRVGTYCKPLREHPDKERRLWKRFENRSFESAIAKEAISIGEVLSLLDYSTFFSMTKGQVPSSDAGIVEHLVAEGFVRRTDNGEEFDITNLGAILFCKNIGDFPSLERKAMRLIFYEGETRARAIREVEGRKGYGAGFSGLVEFVCKLLPKNEEIKKALRAEVQAFPEIAIRELIANALVHQDFDETGTGPMAEFFVDRMEITNPGLPLVEVERFIDAPPRSRNEALAKTMRRLGLCEERGSGIDKVILAVEMYQLPPPLFQALAGQTRATLFAPRDFSKMTHQERVRACYQHSVLQWLGNSHATNASLRRRFKLEDKAYPQVTRIIGDTIRSNLIKSFDPTSKSKKHAKYIPFWA